MNSILIYGDERLSKTSFRSVLAESRARLNAGDRSIKFFPAHELEWIDFPLGASLPLEQLCELAEGSKLDGSVKSVSSGASFDLAALIG